MFLKCWHFENCMEYLFVCCTFNLTIHSVNFCDLWSNKLLLFISKSFLCIIILLQFMKDHFVYNAGLGIFSYIDCTFLCGRILYRLICYAFDGFNQKLFSVFVKSSYNLLCKWLKKLWISNMRALNLNKKKLEPLITEKLKI